MVKLVVHLADIHIRTFRLHEEYKDVLRGFLAQLTDLVKDYSRDELRIVIAGDLETIAPVVIIAGNHDLLENNKDRVDSITPMVQFLPDANVNFFKESRCYLDDNIVWCVYSIFEENARPDIEGARVQFGEDKTYIGLYHAALLNAKTDLGYEIDHGAGLEIFEGCDIVMLGDIHKRQFFNHKGVQVAYPSSLIQQNFGENISKHGFLLWDIQNKTYTEHDVDNKYSMYKFKIRSLEDLENNLEELVNK